MRGKHGNMVKRHIPVPEREMDLFVVVVIEIILPRCQGLKQQNNFVKTTLTHLHLDEAFAEGFLLNQPNTILKITIFVHV